jgi:lysophospholipase L1-like esterase
MKSLLAILVVLFTCYGCKKSAINAAPTQKTNKPDTITNNYLALGDSYTIGQSEPADVSFPVQLATVLTGSGYHTSSPTILAKTGWTTDALIAAIASSNILNNKYQIVTLLIGVNDQYEGLTAEQYRPKFVQLLHSAINFAAGDSTRVFVLSLPDYGVTPFAMGKDSVIGPQIDAFNAVNKQESIKAGVTYVDITAISRQAAMYSTLIAPDGLHPSGAMYQMWVSVLEPVVISRLKKQ